MSFVEAAETSGREDHGRGEFHVITAIIEAAERWEGLASGAYAQTE